MSTEISVQLHSLFLKSYSFRHSSLAEFLVTFCGVRFVDIFWNYLISHEYPACHFFYGVHWNLIYNYILIYSTYIVLFQKISIHIPITVFCLNPPTHVWKFQSSSILPFKYFGFQNLQTHRNFQYDRPSTMGLWIITGTAQFADLYGNIPLVCA